MTLVTDLTDNLAPAYNHGTSTSPAKHSSILEIYPEVNVQGQGSRSRSFISYINSIIITVVVLVVMSIITHRRRGAGFSSSRRAICVLLAQRRAVYHEHLPVAWSSTRLTMKWSRWVVLRWRGWMRLWRRRRRDVADDQSCCALAVLPRRRRVATATSYLSLHQNH